MKPRWNIKTGGGEVSKRGRKPPLFHFSLELKLWIHSLPANRTVSQGKGAGMKCTYSIIMIRNNSLKGIESVVIDQLIKTIKSAVKCFTIHWYFQMGALIWKESIGHTIICMYKLYMHWIFGGNLPHIFLSIFRFKCNTSKYISLLQWKIISQACVLFYF